MKFQSYLKKSVAVVLIGGILVAPMQTLAQAGGSNSLGAAISNSISNVGSSLKNAGVNVTNAAIDTAKSEAGIAGATAANQYNQNANRNNKSSSTKSTMTQVGMGAGMGAATSALSAVSSNVISNVATSGLSSAASGALTGVGSGMFTGALMGAAGGVLTATLGAGWSQVIMGTAGTAISWLMTPFFMQMGVNIDAAQLALEYMIYDTMKNVTDKWDPKPADTYKAAAKSNEDDAAPGTNDLQKGDPSMEKWDFEVQALKNVGIEALNLTNVADIANGRDLIVNNLTRLKKDGNKLRLNTDLDQEKDNAITAMQNKNYQKMSTAGIARAELGLQTVTQAAADAGGDAAQIADSTGVDDSIVMSATGAKNPNTSLAGLPASITSTAMGMRVQAFMNLEMAQRLNLANTLQGNTLSIEAARALKKAPRVIR